MKNSSEKTLFSNPFVITIGIYLIASALLFRFGTVFSDEGFLYHWGQRIIDGDLPYTDFFLQIMPGTFYIQAALMKLFGMSIVAGRIFKQIQGLIVGILTYMIVLRALKNKNAALISMIMSFAWSGSLHLRFHWYTMDAGIFILIGIYFFIRFIESFELKMLALSGLSIGGSILFKQNMTVFVFLAGVILCFILFKRENRPGIFKAIAVFTGTMFIPLMLYMGYYIPAGGDIYKLWQQTVVFPRTIYGYSSVFDMLLYPLQVFLLAHRQDPQYFIGIFLFLLSFFLILAKLRSITFKIAGGMLLVSIALWDAGFFARFSVWTLSFIIFLTTVAVSVYETFKNKNDKLPFLRLSLSMFALGNFYGGIMAGSGFGRFVEVMTGSFYIYGVLVDIIENNEKVKSFWNKTVSWTQKSFIQAGTAAYSVLGLLMIIQNVSFIPGMDFPLYRLNQTMKIEGAKGIIGESRFVNETEAVVNHVKGAFLNSSNGKKDMLVFPYNCMLYPLIGGKNPTNYDALQAIPFTSEFVPDLMKQLEKSNPEIIIVQKRATQTTPLLRDDKVWVNQSAVDAISGFVERNYEKIFETELYYEVFKLTPKREV